MRFWQAGLLVLGAALAGGLAVKLTELPPAAPLRAKAPETPASAEPAPVFAAPAPAPVRSVQPAPPEVASAPPPVYSEPPHVWVKPSPAPRPVPQPEEHPVPTPAAPPIPYQEPAPAHTEVPAEAPPPARRATLESGQGVSVRLLQPLSADRVRLGDIFQGVLATPLVANGFVVGEAGAPVTGRVIDVRRDGITLRLLNFQSADGQRIEVSTEPWSVKSAGPSSIVQFRLAARITVTERRL